VRQVLRAGLAGAVGLLLALSVSPAAAQRAPQYLPVGHWTYDAIRRLNGLGVAPASSDPALAPVTMQHAAEVFRFAQERAAERGLPEAGRIAEQYAALLEAEGNAAEQKLRVGAGLASVAGEMRVSREPVPQHDTIPGWFEDIRAPALTVDGRGPLPLGLSWSLRAALLGDELVVPLATVAAAVGPLDVWVGRQRIHHGVGRSGASTAGSGWHEAPELSRTAADVTGFGIATRNPFHFPSFLRFLGPDRIEMVAGRRSDGPGVTYVVLGRLIGTPFSRRFTLGLNRGAVFGGRGGGLTAARLWGVLVGQYESTDSGPRSSFENQVIAGVVRYRPPVERWVPLELILEMGAEDMAGAIEESPSVIAGFDIAAVPGVEQVSLTFERSFFSSGRGVNVRPWYRHWNLGSWSDDGGLFGHPVGGNGHETLIRIGYAEGNVLVSATGYQRQHGALNLYSPERWGNSSGGSVSVELAGESRWGLRAYGALERGQDWKRHQLLTTATYRF